MEVGGSAGFGGAGVAAACWAEVSRCSSSAKRCRVIAWLILDVTPASIDWKKDVLLGYVEPEQYGPLKTRQEVEAERLKRINAATVFAPQQLVPSEAAQSVVIRGRLRTLVNGFETANELKAYLIEFSYAGARMHLKAFKEVPYASK